MVEDKEKYEKFKAFLDRIHENKRAWGRFSRNVSKFEDNLKPFAES